MRPWGIAVLAAAIALPSFAAPPSNTTGPAAPPHTGDKPPEKAAPAPANRQGDKPQVQPGKPTDPILARLSPVYDQCMRKAVSTLDMVDCAARETERWDARLNRAYQARMTSFNDRQRGALKRAEKAWLSFRDEDCAAYQDEDWGTVSRIDASQCTLRRTVERALELEAFPADHGPG